MSFLPMSLSSFTSTFGFDENDATLNLGRGIFPISSTRRPTRPITVTYLTGATTAQISCPMIGTETFNGGTQRNRSRRTTDSISELNCLSTVDWTFGCFGQGVKSFVESSKSWPTSTLFNTPPLLQPVQGIFASLD